VNIDAPYFQESPPPARSIQAYIDETPVWSDGTPVSWAPMTAMQWRIWTLAAAGKFFEGLVVFMTGVAMPLIAEEFHLSRFAPSNIRATVLASVPWFLQDLGTYGIGIFTPTILAAALGHKTANVRSLADLVGNDELAARGAALIDVLLIVGILAAIFLVDRIGSIRLQIWGFVGCAVGLAVAATSTYVTGANETLLIFTGFMLFNFMTNLGPNAQTYLLSGEVFPTQVRGTGAGFAAAFAKIGAVTTALPPSCSLRTSAQGLCCSS
jgi:hypothetical protein